MMALSASSPFVLRELSLNASAPRKQSSWSITCHPEEGAHPPPSGTRGGPCADRRIFIGNGRRLLTPEPVVADRMVRSSGRFFGRRTSLGASGQDRAAPRSE
jgi:hypothetical protein